MPLRRGGEHGALSKRAFAQRHSLRNTADHGVEADHRLHADAEARLDVADVVAGMRRALGAPLRWRLRSNRFGFPWELWLARSTERLVTRRSLVTGQELRHGMGEVW